ncbi:hypothetical protein Ae201684P_001174 [Aphanomyces euteiches]|nr:hypothetical protein Ae201684P_001174 [Aphanomyces euteiches]
MSKPRVVQVFECPTLPSKRQETAPRTKPKQGEELSHNQLVDEDFQKAVSEVRDFSMKNTTGKDKKKKEIERVVALGGKAPKQQKMPYNMLMAIKKKGAQRQNMRDEQHLALSLARRRAQTRFLGAPSRMPAHSPRRADSRTASSSSRRKIDKDLKEYNYDRGRVWSRPINCMTRV